MDTDYPQDNGVLFPFEGEAILLINRAFPNSPGGFDLLNAQGGMSGILFEKFQFLGGLFL